MHFRQGQKVFGSRKGRRVRIGAPKSNSSRAIGWRVVRGCLKGWLLDATGQSADCEPSPMCFTNAKKNGDARCSSGPNRFTKSVEGTCSKRATIIRDCLGKVGHPLESIYSLQIPALRDLLAVGGVCLRCQLNGSFCAFRRINVYPGVATTPTTASPGPWPKTDVVRVRLLRGIRGGRCRAADLGRRRRNQRPIV